MPARLSGYGRRGERRTRARDRDDIRRLRVRRREERLRGKVNGTNCAESSQRQGTSERDCTKLEPPLELAYSRDESPDLASLVVHLPTVVSFVSGRGGRERAGASIGRFLTVWARVPLRGGEPPIGPAILEHNPGVSTRGKSSAGWPRKSKS